MSKYSLKSEYARLQAIIVSIEGVAYNLKGSDIKTVRPATATTPEQEVIVQAISDAHIDAIMKADKKSPLNKLKRFYQSDAEKTSLGDFHTLGKKSVVKPTV